MEEINENIQETVFTVIDGKKDSSDEPLLKCFKSELRSVEFMTCLELFRGFDTIKAITFSYDIGFINSILGQFQYAEIILGAGFLVEKDKNLNALLTDALTGSYMAAQQIRGNETLIDMMQKGNAEFRSPAFVLDHRKIYLLSSDDGKRTRVITASANMSKRAWNGEHMEFYDYDDSALCYEEYERDFETAWQCSQVIPYEIVTMKKDNDIVDGNAFVNYPRLKSRASNGGFPPPHIRKADMPHLRFYPSDECFPASYAECVSFGHVLHRLSRPELLP